MGFVEEVARQVEELRSIVSLGGEIDFKKVLPEKTVVVVNPDWEGEADRVVRASSEVFVQDDPWVYDALICHELETVDDLDAFLRGAYGRLKAGGKLFIPKRDVAREWRNAYTLQPDKVGLWLERAGFTASENPVCWIGTKIIARVA